MGVTVDQSTLVALFVFVTLSTWPMLAAQSLNGISIVSVSTYATCTDVPSDLPFVNNTAYSIDNTTDSNGFFPCTILNNTVTSIELRLTQQLSAGSTNLQIELNYLIPNGDGTQYSLTNTCQGAAVGGACQVLSTPLVITFDTTQLFAAYEMTPRPLPYPFAYQPYKQSKNIIPGSDNLSYVVVGSTPCKTLEGGVGVGVEYASAGLFGLCPPNDSPLVTPGARQFYGGYDGTVIGSNDQCSALSCRIPKTNGATHISNAFQKLGPQCYAWDLEANPRAIMNIRATLTYNNKNTTVVLGTEQGNTISAVDGVIFMQITNTNFGSGVVANSLPGLIVTCGSCAADDLACNGAPFDDLPTTDDFTLYNPWLFNNPKSCTLPVAKCRQGFKLPAQPQNGFWFYVPPGLAATYAYGVCNSNGFDSYETASGQNSGTSGINNRICASIQQSEASCIPGIQQLPQFSQEQATFTYTPCLVNQLFASVLDCYTSRAQCDRTVSFLPLDYNVAPNLSQYFLHRGKLYRNAIDIGNSQGTVELAMYVSGSFLGTVTNVAAGAFVDQSVRCSSNQNSEGSVVYGVQNKNGTTGSTYTVCANFTLPQGLKPAQLTLIGPTQQIDGRLVICSTIGVPAGGVTYGLFGYRYNGDLGPNSLSVHLVLSAEGASRQYVFAEADANCASVVGVGIAPAFVINNAPSTSNFVPNTFVCHWYNIFCLSGSWWQTLLKILFWLVFAALGGWALYEVLVFTCVFRGYKKAAVVAQQRFEEAAERAEAKRERQREEREELLRATERSRREDRI